MLVAGGDTGVGQPMVEPIEVGLSTAMGSCPTFLQNGRNTQKGKKVAVCCSNLLNIQFSQQTDIFSDGDRLDWNQIKKSGQ